MTLNINILKLLFVIEGHYHITNWIGAGLCYHQKKNIFFHISYANTLYCSRICCCIEDSMRARWRVYIDLCQINYKELLRKVWKKAEPSLLFFFLAGEDTITQRRTGHGGQSSPNHGAWWAHQCLHYLADTDKRHRQMWGTSFLFQL